MSNASNIRIVKDKKAQELKKQVEQLDKLVSKFEKAEKFIHESEMRFKLLAEIAPVGIFRTDANGVTNYVNPHWCKTSGISYKEAMNNGWLMAVHPDDRKLVSKTWETQSTERKPSVAEYRFMDKNGNISWVIGQAVPHKDIDGKVQGYIGTITDITILKNAESALNAKLLSEKLISSIMSKFINNDAYNIDTAINQTLKAVGSFTNVDRSYMFLFSDDEKYIENVYEWCNNKINSGLLQLKNLEITGFSWGISKAKKPQVIKINSVEKLPKTAIKEKKLLQSLGVKSTILFPMVIDNKLYGLLGFDNITKEKKWTEEDQILLGIISEIVLNSLIRLRSADKLRKNEEKDSAIVAALPDLYFRLDKDGVFVDCSHHNSEEFYVPIKSFMGKKMHEILPENVSSIVDEKIKNAFKTQELQVFCYSLNINGEEKWYEARMVVSGKDELLCLVRNITTSIKQQRILEQKNEELEKYTYTVSHDLKSPLITIQGFASFILEESRKNNCTSIEGDLKRIISASQKMSGMLDELLDVSKAGQVVNKKQSIPLSKIVKEVIDLLAISIKEKNAKIIIKNRLPVIKADKNRIKDVMQNLLENALKYSGNKKKPVIEIGHKKHMDKTVIFVKDNGIGIKPEYTKKIFDLFTKLNAQSTGSGIGLTMSKKIIEAHGGQIWAESKGPGKGATFSFYIPKKINL